MPESSGDRGCLATTAWQRISAFSKILLPDAPCSSLCQACILSCQMGVEASRRPPVSSTQMAGVTLLHLPSEVQDAIYKELKYTDLIQLRQTCRGLLSGMRRRVLRSALKQLENDWIAARNTFSELSLGLGYSHDEIATISRRLPCYDCIRLCEPDNFLYGESLALRSQDERYPSMSSTGSKAVGTSRQCLTCRMQSSKYLDDEHSRWFEAKHRKDASRCTTSRWLLVCRGCNKIGRSGIRPPKRQRQADLCHDCWEARIPEWFNFKNVIAVRKKELQAEAQATYRKQQELERYLRYMSKVDEGMSLAYMNAPKMDGLQPPDWKKVRPETVQPLGKLKKSEQSQFDADAGI